MASPVPEVDPLDRFRAAKILIDRHGEEATAHAMKRVIELREAGDDAGNWAWMGVFDAILELQAIRPAVGETLH